MRSLWGRYPQNKLFVAVGVMALASLVSIIIAIPWVARHTLALSCRGWECSFEVATWECDPGLSTSKLFKYMY